MNSFAAAIAAVVWFRAIGTTIAISGRAAVVATCALFGISAWYAGLYFLLGTGILDLPLADTVPLFRWAFIPLVMGAPLRYLTMMATVRGVSSSLAVAQRVTKDGA